MQRWVNLVENNSDPEREAQFNDWYDNMHLPDALASPGIVRARRFQTKEFRDGRAKYLALYEIDSDGRGKYLTMHEIETGDIDETVRLRMSRPAVGRPGLERPLWREIFWKQITDKAAQTGDKR